MSKHIVSLSVHVEVEAPNARLAEDKAFQHADTFKKTGVVMSARYIREVKG